MDVHITYETLFDLLRKERSLDELQHLDVDFWSHVVSYLRERDSFMKKTSMAEQEKTRIQLQNIKRIIKEIYEHRQRKLVNLAINVVRTESAAYLDRGSMLEEEKLLFENLLKLLTTHKQELLLQVLNNDFSLLSPEVSSEDSSKSSSEDSFNSSSDDSSNKSSESISTSSSSYSSSESSNNSQSEESKLKDVSSEENSVSSDDEDILVKFLTSVPKFLGKDKEVFGPYDQGKMVSLPSSLVAILLKKGKVQKVMAD